jgi:hypothetical protein
MRTLLTFAAVVAAMLPALAISQQSDTLCTKVITKKERAALLEGKDARQMEREGYPTDPYEVYGRAKEIGNMRDAWGAIIMAQEGVGAHLDLQKADGLWKDYWCSQVLPAFEDKPDYAWGVLQSSAGRGLPSAMFRISEVYAKGEFGQAVNQRLSQEWREKYEAVRNRRTFGGSCGELSAPVLREGQCKLAYQHIDPEKEAALRLGYIRDAVLQHVLTWRNQDGIFGLKKSSRLPHSTCSQFFQDLISLREVRVAAEGEAEWRTFTGRMPTLPNTDPHFREWTYNGTRFVQGYVVVDWKSARYLLRAHRVCAGPLVQSGVCASLTFAHLDLHDALGPEIACSTQSIAAPYWNNWKGSVTPLQLSTEPTKN